MLTVSSSAIFFSFVGADMVKPMSNGGPPDVTLSGTTSSTPRPGSRLSGQMTEINSKMGGLEAGMKETNDKVGGLEGRMDKLEKKDLDFDDRLDRALDQRLGVVDGIPVVPADELQSSAGPSQARLKPPASQAQPPG